MLRGNETLLVIDSQVTSRAYLSEEVAKDAYSWSGGSRIDILHGLIVHKYGMGPIHSIAHTLMRFKRGR